MVLQLFLFKYFDSGKQTKKLPNVFLGIVDFDARKTLSTVSIVAADCVNEAVQNADTDAAPSEKVV
jgi:hypothetical protein